MIKPLCQNKMSIKRGLLKESDLQRMASLARQFSKDNLHVIDLPYRFSSWALEDPENVRLWFDRQDELAAWAVLQSPFWSVDIFVHPKNGMKFYGETLSWADTRARKVVGTRYGRSAWFVNVFERQENFRMSLESAGFTDQANVDQDPWSKVWLEREFSPVLPENMLPEGYKIRSLSGKSEVRDYVALHRLVFQSESMTEDWRQRTLSHPDYQPELDLMVEAPDGSLAAFCVLWFLGGDHLSYPMGQVEPMGVHPDQRGVGLGKAILLEGLNRLQALGARKVYLETDNYRDAAFGLYESVGFKVIDNVLVYRKDYE